MNVKPLSVPASSGKACQHHEEEVSFQVQDVWKKVMSKLRCKHRTKMNVNQLSVPASSGKAYYQCTGLSVNINTKKLKQGNADRKE